MASENIQEGIKKIKKDLKRTNSRSINLVQELIKERAITSAQATSLLNDIAFGTEALKEIVTAANCIVKYGNLLLKQEGEQENAHKNLKPNAKESNESLESSQSGEPLVSSDIQSQEALEQPAQIETRH